MSSVANGGEKLRSFFRLAAEALGLFLTFVLPLKFASTVGIASLGNDYHTGFLPLLLSAWPLPFLPLLTACFILLVLPAQKNFFRRGIRAEGLFALLCFLILPLSLPGMFLPEVLPNAVMQFLPYFAALGGYALGIILLLEEDPSFGRMLRNALLCGFVCSMISAFFQYAEGFRNTLEFVQDRAGRSAENEFTQNITKRLMESRVSADFTSCNVFAGYLVLLLPLLAGIFWNLGKKVDPPRVSQTLFLLIVLGCGLFLLLKTGSRGGLLAAVSGILILFLTLKTPRGFRITLLALLPLSAAGVCLIAWLGRGLKSLQFRLDYLQGAFRMMLSHPLTGIGWGNFQGEFFRCKMILDPEAPMSPHNLPLTLGSAAGIGGCLLGCVLLVFPLAVAFRHLRKFTLKEAFSGEHFLTVLLYGGCAGWTVQSLLDVTFETPAAMTAAAACSILLIRSCHPEEEVLFPKTAFHLPLLALLSALVLLGSGVRYLRYDAAYQDLAAITDVRLLTPEQLALTTGDAVEHRMMRCEKLEPESPYHLMLGSDWMFYSGDQMRGLQLLEAAIARNPRSAPLHIRRWRLLKTLPGRTKEAEEELETARRLAPRNPRYFREDL